jgi:hypothetical protein
MCVLRRFALGWCACYADGLLRGVQVVRLEWQHCVLHPWPFKYMYDRFWAFGSDTMRAELVPTGWLALLLIVMSHGLATMRLAYAKVGHDGELFSACGASLADPVHCVS